MFESIDSVGDQLQLINEISTKLGLQITDAQIKKIADFLQNVGTIGKNANKLVEAIKGKWNKG